MWRVVRPFLTPRWLLIHLVIWALVIAMVFLGRWQLQVSNEKGFDLQNFSYVLQWWTFSLGGVAFWLRLMRDARRKAPPDHATSGELVLRGGATELDVTGPAMLQTRADSDAPAVVYRGYRLPDSSTQLVRSHGDPMHDAYNDYLWQLALADGSADGPLGNGPMVNAEPMPEPAEPARELE